jgi:hypothetical protein
MYMTTVRMRVVRICGERTVNKFVSSVMNEIYEQSQTYSHAPILSLSIKYSTCHILFPFAVCNLEEPRLRLYQCDVSGIKCDP